MKSVALKDVCEVFGDGDWIETKDQSDSGIRLIQTGNVGVGIFKDRVEKARWISEETFKKLRCTEVLEGDVLISRLPDPVGRSCLIPALEHKAITAVDCSIVRFDPKRMNAKFFIYYSQSSEYEKAIGPLISGSTRQRISREKLGTIKIPLPSLDEQGKIVEKLDSAYAEIDALGKGITERIENTSELFAKICLEKTQDLNPKGFKSLKEIATVITKGTTPTSLGFKFTSAGINFLKVESLGENGGFIGSKFAYIDSACHESLKRSQLLESDVLVSIAGALGRTAIVTADICPANVNQALSLIRLPKDSGMSPNFLFALFQAGYFKFELDRMGAGAAQQNLSLAQIGSLKVPIFPETKQIEFVEFLNELRGLLSGLKNHLEKQNHLKLELQKSILTKTFSHSADNELVD
jgi:type I restriction enzyme S subunit